MYMVIAYSHIDMCVRNIDGKSDNIQMASYAQTLLATNFFKLHQFFYTKLHVTSLCYINLIQSDKEPEHTKSRKNQKFQKQADGVILM